MFQDIAVPLMVTMACLGVYHWCRTSGRTVRADFARLCRRTGLRLVLDAVHDTRPLIPADHLAWLREMAPERRELARLEHENLPADALRFAQARGEHPPGCDGCVMASMRGMSYSDFLALTDEWGRLKIRVQMTEWSRYDLEAGRFVR